MAQRRKLADDILAGVAEVKLTDLSAEALMDLVRLDVTRAALQRRRAGRSWPAAVRTGVVPTHWNAPGCPQRPRRPICYSRRMSVPPAVSPFVPGRGGLPPYLAGRDNEQHALKRLLAYLEHDRGAPRDVIVVGPRGRRYELEQRGLAGVSVSVAAAFRESATLTDRALKSAIATALPGRSSADALQFQEELASVGYVWRSPGAGNLWEPGIPSLMSYIEATERHGGAAP